MRVWIKTNQYLNIASGLAWRRRGNIVWGNGGSVRWRPYASSGINELSHDRKAQVTLCRFGGPDLYDLKNRRERHGRLMKSWQHRTDILEVCSVGSDREASTTKFYCKTLSCWSWLWLRSNHGSISVVCGIGNVVGLSCPAWGHSRTACGHSWTTAYGWSWRSDQYNQSKLSNWRDFYVFIYFKICIYICVYLFIF